MTAERPAPQDCHHCKSAGSIRAGRCQICEWEAAVPAPVRVERADRVDRVDGGGTLTTAGG